MTTQSYVTNDGATLLLISVFAVLEVILFFLFLFLKKRTNLNKCAYETEI